MPADSLIIGLLAAIVVTGYIVEVFRLLAHQPMAPTAAWGFIGYPLAMLIWPLSTDWSVWYNASFWLHFAVTNALLFYLPFSQFVHIIASPIVVTLNAVEETPA
jgi:nitrate reductase gamma subunit